MKTKTEMYRHYKKIAVMAFIWLVIASMPVHAQLLEPWRYLEGTCELAAKEYRNVYGGDLILLMPLKDNGQLESGEYVGEWMNKAWNKERGTYYLDYRNQRYFNTTQEITDFYKATTGKNSVVYNVNEVSVPFSIYWHY